MATNRVNFTDWLPDQPGVIGVLTNAKNVFPKQVGYGPVPQEEDYSGAASENLNSAVAGKTVAGAVRVFAGGSTKLFLVDSNDLSLSDISGTTYSATKNWKFTQFGNLVLAANGAQPIQAADLSTTTISFQNVEASAPTAKYLTVIRDFVVTANQPASNPSRVQWSGINDPTTWSSSAVTQSDFQDIPDGGEIRGITGGEYGLVLLERSIVRMSYVGTPLVFQFDNIARNLGCYEGQSVIQWQGTTYWLSDDGFYSYNGQQIEPIGAEKVNRYFWATMEESRLDEMSAAVDPFRNLVIWGYGSNDNTYRLLIYHWITKRWSYAETNVNRIADFSSPSFTLEALDTISTNLDLIPVSLDSRLWLGGKMIFGGVRGDKLVSFGGQSKEATIETSDLETDGRFSMITLAKPVVDGGLASVGVASRNNLSVTPVFSGQSQADSENRVGLRSLGRYHRLRVIPSGLWRTAIAVDIEIQPAGMR
jgi:hypothetical protein